MRGIRALEESRDEVIGECRMAPKDGKGGTTVREKKREGTDHKSGNSRFLLAR